jgi:formylglycine-generating enzyme required for sulfatase activity
MKRKYFYILAALLIAACTTTIVSHGDDDEDEPASISVRKLNFASDLSAQQFTISNESDGTVSYSVTSNKDWITLKSGSSSAAAAKSASGTVEVGGSVVIVVGIDPSGLSKGTYTGTITIEVDGTKYTISVTITVDDVTATLTVSPTTYNFTAAGGASTAFTVTSNQSWTVTSSATWLTLSKSSGSNNSTFTATAAANTTTAQRTATITVAGGGITRTIAVTQDAATAATLTISPTTYNFVAAGATSSAFTVTSNQSWTVTSSATWLTLSKSSGSNNSTFTATAAANTTTAQRTATITVSCTGITRTINVTQDGVAATLTVTPTTYNFAAAGGTSSSFTVTSNQSWTVTSSASWLTLSKSSGSNNSTFTATATANTATTQRTATITVAGGGGSRTINITQNGNQATQTIEMVSVKGGTFTMGCTIEQGSDCYGNESPAHPVTLSDFYIGKYEVTQKEWYDIMGVNPAASGYGLGSNYPVYYVSWNDIVGTSGASEVINGITYYANGFIYKLNQKTGKKYRLPTEAEWEFAARGGISSKGYKYSGSNTVYNVAWYYSISYSTHLVGTKSPNELGIYDMSGNVWEWCADWYGSYSSAAQTNPTGPTSGSGRVVRGGGWRDDARRARVSFRTANSPGLRHNSIGFRVACSP